MDLLSFYNEEISSKVQSIETLDKQESPDSQPPGQGAIISQSSEVTNAYPKAVLKFDSESKTLGLQMSSQQLKALKQESTFLMKHLRSSHLSKKTSSEVKFSLKVQMYKANLQSLFDSHP